MKMKKMKGFVCMECVLQYAGIERLLVSACAPEMIQCVAQGRKTKPLKVTMNLLYYAISGMTQRKDARVGECFTKARL